MYSLDAGATTYSCSSSSVVLSFSPRDQKTVSELHISLIRLNSPSSVTIARSEWLDIEPTTSDRDGTEFAFI